MPIKTVTLPVEEYERLVKKNEGLEAVCEDLRKANDELRAIIKGKTFYCSGCAGEVERLRKALGDIVKHQEISCGALVKFSGAMQIAKQALEGK